MNQSTVQGRTLTPLYFLGISVLAQTIGAGLGLLLSDLGAPTGFPLGAHALLALSIARTMKLSLPWQLFNFFLWPAVVLVATGGLPGWFIGAVSILALLTYLPTLWTRVPFFPTDPETYDIVLEYLPDDSSGGFIDLGCGFGSMLAYLAKKKPAANFVGVEISPLPFIVCWIRFLFTRNVTVQLKSFWGMSLADYDVVYAFLAPGPMPELEKKFEQELGPENLVLINSFALTRSPVESRPLGKPGRVLYRYAF